MVKPATVNRIRELSRKGHTANYIQKQLRKEHLGIRRTQLLAYVREFKGKAPKKEVYKYTPRKYRARERRIPFEHEVERKYVAIYGSVNGVTKRIEVSGTGYELEDFLRDAVHYPPKKRFVSVSAGRISSRAVFDRKNEWDKRPQIDSI